MRLVIGWALPGPCESIPDAAMDVANASGPARPGPLPPMATAAGSGSYLLQVGSFRDASDADEMKARLALLGMVARVQTVTVNDATWHRVRVGPVQGARQADDMRQRLSDNGIDSLVLQNPE